MFTEATDRSAGMTTAVVASAAPGTLVHPRECAGTVNVYEPIAPKGGVGCYPSSITCPRESDGPLTHAGGDGVRGLTQPSSRGVSVPVTRSGGFTV